MNNIIQLIAEKVKREIEESVIKVIEGEVNLDNIVDSVGEMVNDIGTKTMLAIIDELNDIIKKSPERSKKYHIHKSKVSRTLITRFGELEFERSYYKNIEKNNYVYILDELLGIEKYERIEGNLKGEILDKAANVSYEKAAKLSTPVPITRETVKKIIRENGVIDNLELEIKEKRKVNTIYIEADEDHVPMQNGNNREMRLIYVYDDKTEVNKGRTKLENIRYFTGEMHPEDMWLEVATYIDEAYDLDSVEKIYIAGDGANWIKSGTKIIKDSKYVLDHYHLSKYVKTITAHLGRLDNPICIEEALWEYMKAGNKKSTIEIINLAIEETPMGSKKESMKKAKRYILNNWEGIQKLFGEEKYRCSAEGHISHILSDRLSSRPMGWSVIGADEIARMRTYKANGGSIKEYYRKLRTERSKEEKKLKQDEKIINSIKRAYNNINPDIMIDMPYISRTEGRWLKDMLRSSSF
ncbi:ISLre2 family transposase [Soehngenia longivitae]|uniref:ISLre2 family transposase n=1 Tax=Soehngenia longivitae TaxID=2562294 RepID=A0A4Z0D4J5_9FIRM|nr:ISLre2 family transposase [Soehngenia longivitae]TFZ39133.1 ISLre2 family transposase [Soehngenia longivitae]